MIRLHRRYSVIDGAPVGRLNSFFSDVNAAVRLDIVTGDVPYRHVDYAEDQALARDMQEHGFLIGYVASAAVWHANHYSASGYLHRKHEEYAGLRKNVGVRIEPSVRNLTLGWLRPTLHDLRFALRDQDYGLLRKLRAFWDAPRYNIAARLGQYRAARAPLVDCGIDAHHSPAAGTG
jgi:rhamnosyltransferase